MAGPKIGGGGTAGNPPYLAPDKRPTLEDMEAAWPGAYPLALQYARGTHKPDGKARLMLSIREACMRAPRHESVSIDPGYFIETAKDLVEIARRDGVRMPVRKS